MTSLLGMLVDQQTVWLAEQRRIWQRALSTPRALELALETRTGTTPHEVVFERGTMRLLHYRSNMPTQHVEPVLFCYALINRHYILDLMPDNSVVRRYLDRGFDVYMIDWGVPADDDRGLTLHDYVSELLDGVVDFILRKHERSDLHLLGYCMGGTMAALYTAMHPERVKALTLMAAPIDFGARESLLNIWTSPEHFDVDAFVDANGNCPAIFLQSCFLLMKPVQNMVEKHVAFLEQLDDPKFVSNYFAMESWVNDNIPVAGETFRQFVKCLYQRNELVKGEFRVGGERIDLGRIACPLLVLTARNDHLVAPISTEGILRHVRSKDVESMTIEAGHVGLVVGSKAHRTFWPKATRWLAERSTPAP